MGFFILYFNFKYLFNLKHSKFLKSMWFKVHEFNFDLLIWIINSTFF